MTPRFRLVLWLVCAALGPSIVGCETFIPSRTPGERLYRKRCAQCHGVDGRGNTPRYMGNPWADIVDNSWRYGGERASIENAIHDGILGQMPPNDDLSREQIKQIVDHVVKLRSSGS